MNALVKARASRGIWTAGRPEAGARPERRADPRQRRPRSAAPTSTSTTGTRGRRRPSRCRWPSATSTGRGRRSRQRGHRLQAGRSRLRRRPHHLRPLPQLPRRQAPPVPQHRRRRREPPRRASPSTSSIPAVNVFKLPDAIADEIAAILDPLGNAVHTALVVRPGRRGRADHRRRPDRHHGRGDRALRRRAPRRDHRRQRLPAGAGAQDGRDARGQRHARHARRRDEAARHDGGLRRRAGDVRQRRGAARHAARR